MLTKTKKIALLTTGLAGTLLATTIGGVVLSSCTTGSVTEDPKNPFGNKFTNSIDWNNQTEVSRLNIDRSTGLVYSDQDRTILIGVLPGTSVSELVIPRSVKQISGYINKTGNANNTIPTGAFEGQTTLTSIRFEGSNVQTIGSQAFKDCTSLTTIQLPSSVTTIGNNAFEGTGTVAKINLDNVKFIGNSAFKNAFVNLPPNTVELNLSNAQFIDTMAFMNNTAIKTINFNNNKSLRSIGTSAFENTAISGSINLSNATILKSIGDSAFKNTTNLESVTLPSSLTTLGTNTADSGVFQNSSISSIDLSKTQITNLNQSTFSGASNLSSITLPDTLNVIDVSAFTNAGLTTLDLSNTKVRELRNDSFKGLANVVEIKFPETLTTLGDSVFRESNIETVDLSNTQVTDIKDYTFDSATKLKSIKLPSNLNTIRRNSFYGTTSLESIDLKNTKVTTIGPSAFQNSGITSIALPKSEGSTMTSIDTNAFRGSKIKFADFRSTNLSSLPNSIFEDCSEMEYLLIKSPDLTAVNSSAPSAVQKQITSIGDYAFKNAKKLKGIFHVTDGDTTEQWTPNGIVVASPFLTTLGNSAFYNVPEIRIFDASAVKTPNNEKGFTSPNLFFKDDELASQSKLEAVIWPTALDTPSSTRAYWVGNSSYKNNPKLSYVGTKSTLGFEETTNGPEAGQFNLNPNLRADDYITKLKNPGLNTPAGVSTIEGSAFINTGFESIDLSIEGGFTGRTLGGGNNNENGEGFQNTFQNSLKLKKVKLPKTFTAIRQGTFDNTPLLEEVNFNELTNLSYIGPNNFTNLNNFKSSSITTTPSTDVKPFLLAKSLRDTTPGTPTTDPILDLTDLGITLLPNNSFTGLPHNIKVKLPNSITNASSVYNSTNLTKLVAPSNNDGSSKAEQLKTIKIPAQELRFEEVNGTDTTLQKIQSMAVNLATGKNKGESINTYFYTNPNMDLTKFNELTKLGPSTFNNNPNLESIKLSPKVTTWQISGTTSSGEALTSNYSSAAINNANKLKEISFNGFGGTYDSTNSTFTGNDLDITDLSSTNWENMIKNNSVLWGNISKMMNSLGYDASLEANGTQVNGQQTATVTPGVLGAWVAPANVGDPSLIPWINKDLAEDGSDLKGANKWYTDKNKIGQTSQTADKNISDIAPTSAEKAYFKHNGIIWEWSATLNGTAPSQTISITLTPDQTTLPNVYKAQNRPPRETDNYENYYITTFRSAKVDLTTQSGRANTPSYGVNIKFNIAVQPASKTK